MKAFFDTCNDLDMAEDCALFAKTQLENFTFLYQKAVGDDPKVSFHTITYQY
jgi:hypothetical protein